MSDFSKRFKNLREARGLTQDQAAEMLGISRSTIAGYESEEKSRVPRKETLNKIADCFDTTIDYLLGRSTDIHSTKENKTVAEKLIEYLDVLELTNEEIYENMPFTVDGMFLSKEEAFEFINFVRYQRSKKLQQPASVSKNEEL